jgi:hypothetical protein
VVWAGGFDTVAVDTSARVKHNSAKVVKMMSAAERYWVNLANAVESTT